MTLTEYLTSFISVERNTTIKPKQNLLLGAVCMLIFLLINSGCITTTQSSNRYFVSLQGSDSNTGLSLSKAWRTFDHSLTRLMPGDTLYVDDGVYISEGVYIEDIHGTVSQPIVIMAKNLYQAILTRYDTANPDRSVVEFLSSSNIIFDGFEVFDSLSGNESGIDIRNNSHHITIRNCYVHDCACGGIVSRLSDYLIFEENIVRDNAKRNMWNCSGISIWHPVQYDQEPGYHIQILKNVCFENECDIAFNIPGDDRFNHPNPTDGNGIIVDDFRNTQGGGQEGGYTSPVLVENNLSFNNGGRGINIYQSDNVTIRNNTCFHNLRILGKYFDWAGEISLDNSSGSRIYNNLIVKSPDYNSKALRCYDNDSIYTRVFNNLLVGTQDYCGQNLDEFDNIYKDYTEQDFPKLLNPTIVIDFKSIADFQKYFGLTSSSPAISKGITDDEVTEDLNGTTRPQGNALDIGCFEFVERLD